MPGKVRGPPTGGDTKTTETQISVVTAARYWVHWG